MEYGLIGSKLGHSYSKIIHEMLCGYRYDLCPLPTEEEARAFLTRRQFKAINVTIPYKRLVMEYCTYIDPRAKAIGAVNTVVNKNGLLSYEEAVFSGAQIVINTTPAGMYPNVGVCSLDVAKMPGLEAVLDVVYNPDKTELILRAEEAGTPVAVGGLEMLVAQAVYAAEYFLSRKFDDAAGEIGRITAALRRDMLNVALIGMPSSGKSTVGRALAEKLGKKFIDLDEEIVKADGRRIPALFAAVLLFLDRPLDALTVGGGRPLSSSTEALKKMEAERRPLYLAAADAVIPNSGTVEDAVTAAMEALDEIFSH